MQRAIANVSVISEPDIMKLAAVVPSPPTKETIEPGLSVDAA